MSYVLLQPEATQPTGSAPATHTTTSAPSAAPSANTPAGCAMNAAPIFVALVFLYFISFRPNQKRQKEHELMLKNLRRGVKVRTSGGILGEVADVNDREVTLYVDDRVKINVLRSNISGVETPAQPKASGK
jgi:preprotein translocase subunit YajC